jgi:hypothetical protein
MNKKIKPITFPKIGIEKSKGTLVISIQSVKKIENFNKIVLSNLIILEFI